VGGSVNAGVAIAKIVGKDDNDVGFILREAEEGCEEEE
jgi:hypothetical protein